MDAWSLPAVVSVFAAAALVILVVGRRIAGLADQLADRTGLGEAVTGALLLGATTSLPGIVTTAVGGLEGDGGFAVGNALGGIAVQTLFVAIADLTFSRANLEHAAASLPNVLQAVLLVGLLSLTLLAITGPEIAVLNVHPLSAVLIVVYVFGIRTSSQAHRIPMWQPKQTAETVPDVPAEDSTGAPIARDLMLFALQATVLGSAGYVVGRAGLSIAERTGLSGTEVATLLTGVVTSLPELVVLLAAVRLGALTLGVANIVGGNAFDVLFIPVADVAYRQGSVYHDVDDSTVFVLALTLALTATLVGGLLRRQEGGIGSEGTAIIVLYAVGMTTLLVAF